MTKVKLINGNCIDFNKNCTCKLLYSWLSVMYLPMSAFDSVCDNKGEAKSFEPQSDGDSSEGIELSSCTAGSSEL